MPLDLPAINAAIANTQFAGHLTHLTTVDSTQNVAHAAAQTSLRTGVWIADEQTAGRGRGAHTWHSPSGSEAEVAGLYLTALATPRLTMPSTLGLSLSTAIAVQSAIAETTGLAIPGQIDIRWPNDLVMPQAHGPSRKVGGILIELAAHPVPPGTAASEQALLKYAVIGIGINLNQLAFPPELEPLATSLRRELPNQPVISREPLAAAILRNLDAELRRLAAGVHPARDTAHHSTWLQGKRVRVEARPGDSPGNPNGQPGYTGTTAGLDAQGFLRVHGDDGQLHTVLSGGLREL